MEIKILKLKSYQLWEKMNIYENFVFLGLGGLVKHMFYVHEFDGLSLMTSTTKTRVHGAGQWR